MIIKPKTLNNYGMFSDIGVKPMGQRIDFFYECNDCR